MSGVVHFVRVVVNGCVRHGRAQCAITELFLDVLQKPRSGAVALEYHTRARYLVLAVILFLHAFALLRLFGYIHPPLERR